MSELYNNRRIYSNKTRGRDLSDALARERERNRKNIEPPKENKTGNFRPKFIDESIYDVFYDIPEVWDESDLLQYESYVKHKKYKRHYWIGVIAWMTSCFWGPFTVGFFNTLFSGLFDSFAPLVVMGFSYICIWSFTMPVTLPLSFAIGLWLHPKVLEALIFDTKHPYDSEMMMMIGHSKEQERMNSFSVAAGYMAGSRKRRR